MYDCTIEGLEETLRLIHDAKSRLNREKYKVRTSKVGYFGHLISEEGISPRTERIKAIVDLSAPINVTELRIVIGMINYLGRFIPDLSYVVQTMTDC